MKLLGKRTLLTLLTVFLFVPGIQAQPDIKSVEESIHQRISEGNILGIAIAYIYPDGRTQFISRGFLSASRKQNVDKNTIFEIGSVTKTFTGLILAQMVQDHEVAMDDPIGKFLPDSIHEPSFDGQNITLLDLATHTSGLPRIPSNFSPENNLNPYADYTKQQLYNFLNHYKLSKAPGTLYQYSNVGMGLLGHILALVSHQSYARLLKQYVTAPLQMDDTEIDVPARKKDRFATPYNFGKAASHWKFPTLTGAGGIRSTSADMVTYVKAQLGIQESDMDESITKTHGMQFDIGRRNIDAIGLAWIQSTQQDTIIWHNGETGGFRSFVGFNAEKGTGVVVLTNGRDNVDDIGFHLLDEHHQLRRVKHSISVDPAILQRYTGTYKISPDFAITITKTDNQLAEQATGQQSLHIYPESETRFFLKVVDAEIEFISDSKGNYEQLKLYQNGHVLQGKKVKQD